MPQLEEKSLETFFTPRCIYCNQGSTEKNPTLFSVYAPGTYWQHWNFENKGCAENKENISPNGQAVPKSLN